MHIGADRQHVVLQQPVRLALWLWAIGCVLHLCIMSDAHVALQL